MSKPRKSMKKMDDRLPIIMPPQIQSDVNSSEFESLSKFLDTNRDDPLHNSIYFCLKNAAVLSAVHNDQSEIIINIMKVPAPQQEIILKLFKERLADIKLRKQIETDMSTS
jgi:hypothetical protein